MHELAIMEAAMDAVWREARSRNAERVHRIVLRIGALSGVEPDALRFAFDLVTRDTQASGAELEIDAIPARAHCAACDRDFEAGVDFVTSCPACGRISSDLRGGRELELARVEIS